MQLTDEQKQKVASWLEADVKMSDVQSRLNTEFGLKLTYMEVRFLIDDLKLKVKDKPVVATPILGAAKPAATAPAPAPGLPADDAALPPEGELPPGLSNVKVSVDTIAKPGALVSGKVTFSDGQNAAWYLDQMGRLGMTADTKGYRPSQPDLIDFQNALQDELAKIGY
jgi:hypothetical protein